MVESMSASPGRVGTVSPVLLTTTLMGVVVMETILAVEAAVKAAVKATVVAGGVGLVV